MNPRGSALSPKDLGWLAGWLAGWFCLTKNKWEIKTGVQEREMGGR